jgi:hypothetical protein
MYEGSFEPEAEKKTKMKTAHAMQKRIQSKPLAAGSVSRQLRTHVASHTKSHGSRPKPKIGTK